MPCAFPAIACLGLLFMGARAQIVVAPLQPVVTGNSADGIYLADQDPNPTVPSNWTIITKHPVVGIHTAHIPGTNSYLWIGRTRGIKFVPANVSDIFVGLYNHDTGSWNNVTQHSNPFCGGLTIGHDGSVLVIGGTNTTGNGWPSGMAGIRRYDHTKSPLDLPETVMMSTNRWYPTPTLLADNTILITGGTTTGAEYVSNQTKFFERWDPKTPTKFPLDQYPVEPLLYTQTGKNFYPNMFVLPSGEVFESVDNYSRIIKADNTYRQGPGGSALSAPPFPAQWKTQYPHAGSSVLTALTYENNYSSVDIIKFGGAPASSRCLVGYAKIPANPFSYRITINMTKKGADWTYTFSDWKEELMGIPRVGGDAILLPNGDVLVLGGAQTGCIGGIKDGINRGNNPAFWPVLYQPDRPLGKRYTVLAATSIARMYHGSSVLTSDGTILVQGCDACDSRTIFTNATFYDGNDPKLDAAREYRGEIFYPPYALDINAKPQITGVNTATNASTVVDATYGGNITIKWRALSAGQTNVTVTRVSLVSCGAITHNFDTNQRVVFLEIVARAAGSVTVRVPNMLGVLPPQLYQIFAMNVKTYSRAWWVKLTGPDGPPAT